MPDEAPNVGLTFWHTFDRVVGVRCPLLQHSNTPAGRPFDYFFSRCRTPFCVSISILKLLKKFNPKRPETLGSGTASWTAAVRFLISIPPTAIESRFVSGAWISPLAVWNGMVRGF